MATVWDKILTDTAAAEVKAMALVQVPGLNPQDC